MNDEKELIRFLSEKRQIFLYGAGMVGGLVKSRLEAGGLIGRIICFVTTKKGNTNNYMGIPICGFEEIENIDVDSCILVCALSKTRAEIMHELESRGIEGIPITDKLLSDMENNYLWEQAALRKNVLSQKYDVLVFSQDNNATSGAFISMVGLCEELQEQSDLNILVVLPRYGNGEELLRNNNLDYTYLKRQMQWIYADSSETKKEWEDYSLYDKNEIDILKALISETGVNLVHMSGMFVFAGAIAAAEVGIPVIWHIRENIMTQGNRFINERAAYELLNASAAVICVSEYVHKAYHGLDESKISIVYNGADERRFYQKRKIMTGELCRIVMVGHITRLKGQEVLVRALAYLKKTGNAIPSVTFVGSSDSGYLEELRGMITENGLEMQISFVGRTAEPEKFYHSADIAVSATSGGEGFDRVRIEAMLSGCLLLANDAGAAREIVEDGVTGYLYKSGDDRSLAQTLVKAMRSVEHARMIAEKGQQLCMEKFTKVCNGQEVLALYRKILGNG